MRPRRDRHATAGEISCGAGRCKHLATWKVTSDTMRNEHSAKTWVFCSLHKYASVELLRERGFLTIPTIEPFQDIHDRPPRTPAGRKP